jgi:hypothetical protein
VDVDADEEVDALVVGVEVVVVLDASDELDDVLVAAVVESPCTRGMTRTIPGCKTVERVMWFLAARVFQSTRNCWEIDHQELPFCTV